MLTLIRPGEPGFIERRSRRRPFCSLEVTIRQRGRFAVAGESADLTPAGARIEQAGPFAPGCEVWVRLPGLEGQSGRVAWSEGTTTGVAFDRELHSAVYSRFLPDDSVMALVAEPSPPQPMPAEIAVLPRREQIVRGYGASQEGPARHTKSPRGGGLAHSIRRSVPRRVEHREEERFFDSVRTGPMRLTIARRDAEVRNVSASGLKVACPVEHEIGAQIAVAFDGFDPLAGRVVWRRLGEMGISLRRDSLALNEA